MSQHILNIERRDETRGLIIGAPLLLVAVFCFVLIMAHPATGGGVKSASSSDTSKSKSAPQSAYSSVHELKPLPLASPDSATMSSASETDNPSMGNSTASPQSTSGKDSAASNAQNSATTTPSPSVNSAKARNLRVSSGSTGFSGGLLNSVFTNLTRGL